MSTWNLSHFYSDPALFEEDLARIKPKIEELHTFQGKLHDFASFKAFYELEEDVTKRFYRLFGYIHLSSDLNLKDQNVAAKKEEVLILLSELHQKTSFVAPEIIAIGQEKVMSFLEKDDFLRDYTFPLEKLFFQQKHVLSSDQEKILAHFQATRNIPTSLYQALAIVDAKDEKVVLSDQKEVTVTPSNFRSLLTKRKDAEDRKLIFEAAFKRYYENKTAFASVYNLVLMQQKANYTSRNHDSALDAALFKNNIPTTVFHNLKDVAYENTSPLKRYIALRKKHLNLPEYHTYDRFMKLSEDPNTYGFKEAKHLFFQAIEGMDSAYVRYQKQALEDGFVDAFPADGKRTGAYSSGLYGFHPFILLNHDETLSSVFTLAHEAGHSAHTMLANDHQPLATADYTIFVAEIASTFNEHVLLDYLVKHAETKAQKISLLESAINGILSTFYRQTLFATYEYRASELVRKGIPITANALSNIMIELYEHYYGLDIRKEHYKPFVWAYIPHFFHTPFYVYQYATSYSASLKIYQNVRENKPNAMQNFLGLLKSGGNDYPVNQASRAGADLTKKETFMAVIHRLNDLINELEKTLESS
jgi:oligoendopeptidase F